MTPLYFGWICTGPMRPGTFSEGLEGSWPYVLLAVALAIVAAFVPRIASRRTLRIILWSILALTITASLAWAWLLFDIGKNCQSATPSDYRQLLDKNGLK